MNKFLFLVATSLSLSAMEQSSDVMDAFNALMNTIRQKKEEKRTARIFIVHPKQQEQQLKALKKEYDDYLLDDTIIESYSDKSPLRKKISLSSHKKRNEKRVSFLQ